MACNLTELDFSVPKHVELLDKAVAAMFAGSPNERRLAEKMLTDLKDDALSWTKVDRILESSTNQQTKYFALQILEQVITTRWRSLPRTQCEGIKKYVVGLIIKTSMVRETMEREKMFLNKLNLILIQVVKREWPKRWDSFIPDIVGSSKKNESLCQNNMIILQLLSEEVFDFSAGKMTQTKIRHLKSTMCNEFQMIFELCIFVMDNSQNAPLVEATLETFLKFLSWIPVGFIFETKIIDVLIVKFLNVPLFRNVTLKCLTEIAALDAPSYGPLVTKFFVDVMALLVQMLPPDTNIAESYNASTEQEQNFIQNLAMFLSIILKKHRDVMEGNQLETCYLKALQYLLLMTSVDELEVFKICLDYWAWLCYDLYDNMMRITMLEAQIKLRHPFYTDVLTDLRPRIIGRMAKPKEVLVVENENGEVVREVLNDTDSVILYKTMRQTLSSLASLDCVGMETVMVNALESIARGDSYSWHNLNTLCWAIGSISGSMPEVSEKNFLVVVIRNLLTLCEEKRGKDNKAIIASNIMYVVGQYPGFLRSHWKFLKTVVNKLFEFMHETHDGVQDMACDTFLRISTKCATEFLVQQDNEPRPMVHEMVECSGEIVNDLQPHQVHCFYQAVGTVVGACEVADTQGQLVARLMRLPNRVWAEAMDRATRDVDALKEQHTVRRLTVLLQTNTRTCDAVGHGFAAQLSHIFVDMLNVYRVTTDNINAAIAANGEAVTRQPLLKNMMSLKKEIICLVTTWLEHSQCGELRDKFLTPFLEVVLSDYRCAPAPSARETEVLRAVTVVVKLLKAQSLDLMPAILDAVFEPTLDMINKDMEEHPEFRTHFFQFVRGINKHCFDALLAVTPRQFKLVLDSVIWAMKHTMRDVADVGLEILYQLLFNIQKHPAAAQSFYQTYYTEILQHVFSVLTDSSQAPGLNMQVTILSHMFAVVENGIVSVALSTGTNLPADNITYIEEFVAGLLHAAFPHLTDHQVKVVIKGLFDLDETHNEFKAHLRDFLVQIREYAGEDDCDLYLDEREEELRKTAADKLFSRMSVPGILEPYEAVDPLFIRMAFGSPHSF